MPVLSNINLPFNSASLWASTYDDLRKIYTCPHSGALTTRTACSTDTGYPHDDRFHQHAFFSATSQRSAPKSADDLSTLNTLGYSPYPLRYYIDVIKKIQLEHDGPHKPVIFSVAGNAATILACHALLVKRRDPIACPWEEWCLEINLSCPNIAGAPPPAYSRTELARLLSEVSEGVKTNLLRSKAQLEKSGISGEEVTLRLKNWNIPIGLKLPPYTFANQFDDVVETVRQANATSGSGSNILLDGGNLKVEGLPESRTEAPDPSNSTAGATFASQGTINPALLSPTSRDIDATLAEDLAVSLSLDDALSQAPSIEKDSQLWRILTPPFPVSFLTSTNTLGSCIHLTPITTDEEMSSSGDNDDDDDDDDDDDEDHDRNKDDTQRGNWRPTLNSYDGSGLGGLAGASLHPLSLGNVKNLKVRLARYEHTERIRLIGVGGVSDGDGFSRMKAVGADAVALASAMGRAGVSVFEDIVHQAGLDPGKMEASSAVFEIPHR